jgi:hypothetical protein
MSADNFIQVRKFDEEWFYANLSASQYWSSKVDWSELDLDREVYDQGPFDTEDEAFDHAEENISVIEYGFETFHLDVDSEVTAFEDDDKPIVVDDSEHIPDGDDDDGHD